MKNLQYPSQHMIVLEKALVQSNLHRFGLFYIKVTHQKSNRAKIAGQNFIDVHPLARLSLDSLSRGRGILEAQPE